MLCGLLFPLMLALLHAKDYGCGHIGKGLLDFGGEPAFAEGGEDIGRMGGTHAVEEGGLELTDGKKFLLDVKVPISEISRDAFKPVRIGVSPVPSERTFAWMAGWAISCSMGRCYVAGHDDRFEIWLSLKLDEKGGLLCDRAIFVKVE